MLELDDTTATKNVSSVLINRQGALGDVLLITPFLPVLLSRHPNAKIDIRTDSTEILLNNPYINKLIFYDAPIDIGTYDRVIDLNLSYEKEPKLHIIDTYKKHFKVQPIPEKPQLFLTAEDNLFAENIFRTIGPFIVFDIGITWPSRSWPLSHYVRLARLFKNEGFKILELGITDQTIGGTFNLTNETTIHQAAAIISKSLFFVGPDSLLGHIAPIFDKPTFLFFGSILPETRILRGSPFVKPLLNKDIPCLGCHHNLPIPTTFSTCLRGDNYCMTSLSPEFVFNEIKVFLKNIY